MRKKIILTHKQTRSNEVIAAGYCILIILNPLSECQLNDIINISWDGVEVKGDTITSLCEVDTLVGAKDGGRLDFVVASRDEEAGVHTV